MKLSARNVLKGKITSIKPGAVNALVKVDVGGQAISSIITLDALGDLALKEGDEAYVIIKASSVMLGKD